MRRPLEPGVLPLLRAFVALEALLLLLRPLADAVRPPPLPAPSPWPALALQIAFLGYLCSARLRGRLGAAYLPAALAFAVAGPLAGSAFALRMGLAAGVPAAELVRQSWLTIVVLLVPVILIAWQYGFRWVLWTSLLVAAADLAASLPLAARGGPAPLTLFAVALARCLFFMPVGYAVARLADAQRRQRDALEQANARLARYAQTLELLAVSRERNRLARELHDTLAHGLSAVAVQLGAVQAVWESRPEEARGGVAVALDATRAALGDARRAIADLRARPLEDLGLPQALRELALSAAAREGLALELDVPPEAPPLGPAAEQAFYRVAAEALANVTRHARARRVAVRFAGSEGGASLVVADDGRGFDTAAAVDGGCFGLAGMRERAEAVGGALEVESAPGSGTSLRLTLRRPDDPGPDL